MPDQSRLPEQRLWVEDARAGVARSWSKMVGPTAAPEAEIQVQSSQALLRVELGKFFSHTKVQVETRYLADCILFLMKSATASVRREMWGASSVIPGKHANYTLSVTG